MPTIDDLPIENYKEYAKRVEEQGKAPIQYTDDKLIAGPVRIDTTIPSYPLHIDALTGEVNVGTPYALFTPPTQGGRGCFASDRIVPWSSLAQFEELQKKLENLDGSK